MTLIPILFEHEASRSNPRNGAGAHSRFGHKAMIASASSPGIRRPDATQTRGSKKSGNFFIPIGSNPLKSPDSEK
jgi:hypothetical protein